MDNLPIPLLVDFARNLLVGEDNPIERAAISIDSRNQNYLGDLNHALKAVQKMGVYLEFMFLEAEEAILVKRYSETRRIHPLMGADVSLLDAIRLERQMLAPLSERAVKHLDTTQLTPHGLRALIQEDAAEFHVGREILQLKSFAYKYGAPLDADYVFDVRCLPNPYWIVELKQFNGTQQPVQAFFSTRPEVQRMIDKIDAFISDWLHLFHANGRPYLIVAIGCTGGRHRSVYVVEKLEERFKSRGLLIQKRHSEIA